MKYDRNGYRCALCTKLYRLPVDLGCYTCRSGFEKLKAIKPKRKAGRPRKKKSNPT